MVEDRSAACDMSDQPIANPDRGRFASRNLNVDRLTTMISGVMLLRIVSGVLQKSRKGRAISDHQLSMAPAYSKDLTHTPPLGWWSLIAKTLNLLK